MPATPAPQTVEAPVRGTRFRIDRGILALIVIVAVGAVLRLIGIWWGLPHELHTDEPVIVNGAVDLARRHSFEPSVYFRPDHVEIQISDLVYQAYAKVFLHTSVVLGFAAHPATFLLLSRLVTVVFGLGMIVLAYFIGREFSRSVGLVAAVLVAILPPFVEHSHYATPDVPLTAALMGVILACMRYLRTPSVRALLLASACTSIAIAIKYPGALATAVIALVVVIMAIRDGQPWRILRHGVLAVAAVIVFLFFISPVLFTNVEAVKASVHGESRGGRAGSAGAGIVHNVLFYLGYGAGVLGVLLLVAAVVGVVLAIRRRALIAVPLVISVVVFLGLSVLPIHWDRWSLPMLVAPLIFAAVGLVWAWQMAPGVLRSTAVRRTLLAVVGVLILSNLLLQSVATDVMLSAPDTRIALGARFAKLGITKHNSIYEGYTPLANAELKLIFSDIPLRNGVLAPVAPSKHWIVISSCTYSRFYGVPQYSAQRAFYSALKNKFPLALSTNAQMATSTTGIEPLNDYLAIKTIAGYASGGEAGCDIRVYSIPHSS
jgi:4-amino-4-deoxy-L-arabinose transferase-like glycosyltransferase